MKDSPLWKYCTAAQCRELLLSMELLDRRIWTDEKYLACLYALSNHPEEHYRPVRIAKRDGSVRQLYEPDYLLKQVQKNILHRVLSQQPVSGYATAYRCGSGIRANALPHCNKDLIVKVDIEDFFGHITFDMVYRYAFPAIYYPPPVRTLLTHLCCYKEYLPQGAPTSAAISNLVLKPFDEHMGAWCGERSIAYTRYCDDITCSGSFRPGPVIGKLSGFLQAMGFYLNEQKTRVIRPGRHQTVTGLTVNRKVQVPAGYRRKLRKDIYYCRKYGAGSHLQRVGDTDYLPEGQAGIHRYLQSLLGKVNYILSVNPEDVYFCRARDMIRQWIAAGQNI